jgi:hypothetical protein
MESKIAIYCQKQLLGWALNHKKYKILSSKILEIYEEHSFFSHISIHFFPGVQQLIEDQTLQRFFLNLYHPDMVQI